MHLDLVWWIENYCDVALISLHYHLVLLLVLLMLEQIAWEGCDVDDQGSSDDDGTVGDSGFTADTIGDPWGFFADDGCFNDAVGSGIISCNWICCNGFSITNYCWRCNFHWYFIQCWFTTDGTDSSMLLFCLQMIFIITSAGSALTRILINNSTVNSFISDLLFFNCHTKNK